MKLKALAGASLLTLLSVITASAQGLPCGGDDPDATCPIDSWVIILVAAASLFAVYSLLKRKNSPQVSTIR
jgi:hypothetical protein